MSDCENQLTDFPGRNLNVTEAYLVIEEFRRMGLTHAVICPGSRSSPLAAALECVPGIKTTVHFDERGAAFYALGCARASGRPVAWITTSGTAVAEGLPAVVEAAQSHVPLLLLTADRPPELLERGANQTIRQRGIFGSYAVAEFQFACPEKDSFAPDEILIRCREAWLAACPPFAGPVHLNFMFRDPLEPSVKEGDSAPFSEWLALYRTGHTEQGAAVQSGPRFTIPDDLLKTLRTVRRGIVVAGNLLEPSEADQALKVAQHLGWPLIPDPASQLRFGSDSPLILAYSDLLFGPGKQAERFRPEAVLQFGGHLVSKRVMQFLRASAPATYAVVRNHGDLLDPDNITTHQLTGSAAGFAAHLLELGPASDPDSSWAGALGMLNRLIGSTLEKTFEQLTEITEPGVARMVTHLSPDHSGLVMASSMPVRDVDMFGISPGNRVICCASRGASGIDGTMATAAGFADGLGAPVTCLCGDLSFLHDLNSLALLRRPGCKVVVVIVNNDGGGIFHFLPIHEHQEIFEKYFGVAHGLTFEKAAELFGIPYTQPENLAELGAALAEAHAGKESSIIEVRTDRETNLLVHRLIQEQVRKELEHAR